MDEQSLSQESARSVKKSSPGYKEETLLRQIVLYLSLRIRRPEEAGCCGIGNWGPNRDFMLSNLACHRCHKSEPVATTRFTIREALTLLIAFAYLVGLRSRGRIDVCLPCV